jgi:hypothetical protein
MSTDEVDALEAEVLDELEAAEDAEAPEGTTSLAAARRRHAAHAGGRGVTEPKTPAPRSVC